MPVKPTQIDEGLWRGPRPTIEFLVSGKYASVIDLEGPKMEAVEVSECLAQGVHPYLVPISPLTRPDLNKVRMAVSFMQAVPKPLYLHCKQGVDRTGVVSASYRVWVQGWSVDRAWQEMFNLGFHRFRYFYWLPRIRKILES